MDMFNQGNYSSPCDPFMHTVHLSDFMDFQSPNTMISLSHICPVPLRSAVAWGSHFFFFFFFFWSRSCCRRAYLLDASVVSVVLAPAPLSALVPLSLLVSPASVLGPHVLGPLVLLGPPVLLGPDVLRVLGPIASVIIAKKVCRGQYILPLVFSERAG
jgi:hypothetical protein